MPSGWPSAGAAGRARTDAPLASGPRLLHDARTNTLALFLALTGCGIDKAGDDSGTTANPFDMSEFGGCPEPFTRVDELDGKDDHRASSTFDDAERPTIWDWVERADAIDRGKGGLTDPDEDRRIRGHRLD